MAVTLTVENAAEQFHVRRRYTDPGDARLGQWKESPEDVDDEFRTVWAAAVDVIERRAPSAPSDVQNRAALQYAGHLYDRDSPEKQLTIGSRASSYDRTTNIWRSSGAADMLNPWIARGLGTAG